MASFPECISIAAQEKPIALIMQSDMIIARKQKLVLLVESHCAPELLRKRVFGGANEHRL